MTKICLAVRHVAFEDLGLLGPLVASRGYGVRYHDAGMQPFDAETLLAPDLLIVLGGPIGVYERDAYPFIADEIAAIAARLAADKPMLGICLGAQMMAAALGARVAPGPVKEIGWAPLTLSSAGRKSVLAPLDASPVLHWHGDNCELPAGCMRLASTPALPGAGVYAHALAARAAISSGNRAGAVRKLARRPHSRTRQSRPRSARTARSKRARSGRQRANSDKKCWRRGSTRRWRRPFEFSRHRRRLAVESAGAPRQAVAKPAACGADLVSRRRAGAGFVHAGG